MKKILILILFGILCNCNPKDNPAVLSENLAGQFYETIKTGKFDEIKPLIDSTTFESAPLDSWINLLENKKNELGNLKSYQKIDRKTKETGSLKEFLVKYHVVYEKDTTFELIGTKSLYDKTEITQYQYANTETELESKWKNF